MNLSVVYCTYRDAKLDVRERLSFASDEDVLRAHAELSRRHPGCEHVVVSTCNRVELYVARPGEDPPPNHADLVSFLSEFHDLPAPDFAEELLRAEGPDAVRHLFEVAAGIDSMVVGESQIVQQVKKAYDLSTRGDASGPVTHSLFQRALRVASRVRAETRIGDGRLSVASVAVGEFAKLIFDRFADKRVLVLGAGEMARETLQYLKAEGVRQLTVANRTRERAEATAAEFGGRGVDWACMPASLAASDIVVAATGSPVPVLTADHVRAARLSPERPLLLLDLGTPRDIDPAAAAVDDAVFLYNVDDLEAACERNRRKRRKEIDRARGIVAEETERFAQDVYHRATGPIVKQLRETWSGVAEAELEALFRRLPDASEQDREAIRRSVHRITQRLLHPPLEAIREEAQEGTPDGLLDAVRRLFGLR